MKILVAVKSYKNMWDRGAHQRIRESWGLLCPGAVMDLRFFMGGRPDPLLEPHKDEIMVDAHDDYWGLSEKVNRILEWALDKRYDYIVLADTDTFLHIPRLAALPWGDFDYTGLLLPYERGFMFGGCGFVISRDAAEIVLNNDITHKMDDINIGKILLHRPQPDIRVWPCVWDRRIGWHFPKNTYSVRNYDPQFPWMSMMAQAHLGFPKKHHYWSTVIGGAERKIVLELSRMDREDI